MSRFPTEVKDVGVRGLAGTGRVRFIGTIPHGNSTRTVAMDVHPDLIVKIAAALIATRDCACDSEWQRSHRHHSEMGWQPGHAIWHVENPDRPMPCVDHSKVIDMNTIAASVQDAQDSEE
jgi:hypothetical protein